MDIVNNHVVNRDALEKFRSDFRSTIEPDDKLGENYSDASLDIESHEMFGALYTSENVFVACTGIYRRNQWPQGAYRLLNRTYFNPAFRESYHFGFYASDYLVPFQMQKCKSPLEFTFVSRQGKNGGNFLKKLKERPFFKDKYLISDEFVQVVPGGLDINCFQKILYSKTVSKKFSFNGVHDLNALSKIIQIDL